MHLSEHKASISSSLLKGVHFIIQSLKRIKRKLKYWGMCSNVRNDRGQVLFVGEVSVSIATCVVLLKGTSQTLGILIFIYF